MTPAANNNHYHQDKSNSKRILPQDFIGQHFVHYFNHGWSFIEAKVPMEGEKAQWRTECHYPLELPILWSKYLEEETILGLRFGSFTNYFLLDIDRWSCYHPLNNKQRFNDILKAMEEIGGRRPVIVQSSDSGGIHIYYFLPEHVHTFTLALTVKRALNKHKLILVPGRLEIFPNVKGWRSDKVSNYNGHRLPLQYGSYLLDADLEPISQDVYLFLEQADYSSENQNMLQLNAAMTEAKKQKFYIIQQQRSRGEEWCLELQRLISIGWTGLHQTNDQLIVLGKYGVIFLRLTGEELRNYMYQTAINSPGYVTYCRHQHEIARRVEDVARWAEGYYEPYANKPIRNKTYREQFYSAEVIYIQDPSQRRHQDGLYRAQAVITMLKSQGLFPDTVMGRQNAIIEKAKELFNMGFSPNTLHKDEYKYLWHPLWEVVGEEPIETKNEATVNADFGVEENGEIRFLVSEPKKEGKIEVSQEEGLQVVSIYEGMWVVPDCETEANKSTTPISEEFETEAKGEGEGDYEAPELVVTNNQSHTRISLVLDKLITLSLCSIITNSSTANNLINLTNSENLSYLVKELNANSLSQLVNFNSPDSINCLISLMEVLEANQNQPEVQEVINYLTQVFNQCDQCLQCSNTLKAPLSNTDLHYKQNLFVFLAAANRHVLLCSTPSVTAVQEALPSQEVGGEDTNANLEEDDQEAAYN